MSHTPTPWKANSSIVIDSDSGIVALLHNGYDDFDNAKANAQRIVACVNACAEFPDPKIDIGLLKLDNEQKAKLLASCETALTERNTEIVQLKARVKQLEYPWISVNKKTPQNNDLYLTLGWDGTAPYVTRFEDGKWFETEYDFDNDEFPNVSKHITHWMPIIHPSKPQQ